MLERQVRHRASEVAARHARQRDGAARGEVVVDRSAASAQIGKEARTDAARFVLRIGACDGVRARNDIARERTRLSVELERDAVWQRIRVVRRQGTSLDVGTYRPDIFGISAPLLDLQGNIQGALTLTGLRHGHTKQQIERWRKVVLEKAKELNQGRKQKTP